MSATYLLDLSHISSLLFEPANFKTVVLDGILARSMTALRYYACLPDRNYLLHSQLLKYGTLALFKWYTDEKMTKILPREIMWSDDCLLTALRYDHYDFIKILVKIPEAMCSLHKYKNMYRIREFWNISLPVVAVETQNKDFLFDCYRSRYSSASYFHPIWAAQVYEAAIILSSLEMLKYLYDLDSRTIGTEIVQKLVTSDWQPHFYSLAHNNLEIIKWLYYLQCPWDEEVSTTIAQEKSWTSLRWLLNHNCPYDATQLQSLVRGYEHLLPPLQ